jgi:hypothetical protein
VDAQPTAYDLEKVIEDLEDLRDGNYDFDCCPYKEPPFPVINAI